MDQNITQTPEEMNNVLKAQKQALRRAMKQKLSNLSKESINNQSTKIYEKLKRFQPYIEAKRVGIYLSMPGGEVQTDAIVRHALRSGKQVFVPYLYHEALTKPLHSSISSSSSIVTKRSVMDMVDLRSLADYDSLKPDAWGIPTIQKETVGQREHILKDATASSRGLDLILMPGVAFEQDTEKVFIKRLGHGKGFYDFFLERYQLRGNRGSQAKEETATGQEQEIDALLYGLALEEQVLHPPYFAALSLPVESVPVGPLDKPLHGLVVGDGAMYEVLANTAT